MRLVEETFKCERGVYAKEATSKPEPHSSAKHFYLVPIDGINLAWRHIAILIDGLKNEPSRY